VLDHRRRTPFCGSSCSHNICSGSNIVVSPRPCSLRLWSLSMFKRSYQDKVHMPSSNMRPRITPSWDRSSQDPSSKVQNQSKDSIFSSWVTSMTSSGRCARSNYRGNESVRVILHSEGGTLRSMNVFFTSKGCPARRSAKLWSKVCRP
jgi:hypothetical protein